MSGGLPFGLAELQREAASGRSLPPVERWNPAHCGDIDIRIARDGTWFHQGSPIGRKELVRLFSTILRKDGADYVLVTPAEKMRIVVEDAPFLAVLMDVEGEGRGQHLVFTTNVGDTAVAGPDNPIRVETDPVTEEPAPYVHVRSGLEAKIARAVFYRLVDLAVVEDGMARRVELRRVLRDRPRAVRVTLDSLKPLLLAEAPALPLAPKRGDYDLDPANRPAEPVRLVPAAVLLPIVLRETPTVLFTERSARLARHAGQVSFPGGRSDPQDASLVHTALRETQEETGIVPDFVTVAGFLDAYETGTGFAILPVVGLVREGFALAPDTDEVAEIFEVPLAFLLDPANRQKNQTEWKGRMRHYYAFRYHGHYIWGATAAMLVNFAERMAR